MNCFLIAGTLFLLSPNDILVPVESTRWYLHESYAVFANSDLMLHGMMQSNPGHAIAISIDQELASQGIVAVIEECHNIALENQSE